MIEDCVFVVTRFDRKKEGGNENENENKNEIFFKNILFF